MSEVKKYEFNGNIVEAIQYTEKSGVLLNKIEDFSDNIIVDKGNTEEYRSGQTNGGLYPFATVEIEGRYTNLVVDIDDWIVKFNEDCVMPATDDMAKNYFVEVESDSEEDNWLKNPAKEPRVWMATGTQENSEGFIETVYKEVKNNKKSGELYLDKTDMPIKLEDLDLSDMPTHPLTDEDGNEERNKGQYKQMCIHDNNVSWGTKVKDEQEEKKVDEKTVHSLIINLTEKEQLIFREVDGDLTYERMDKIQVDFMNGGEDNIFFAAKGEEYVFSREYIKNILILEGTYACYDR